MDGSTSRFSFGDISNASTSNNSDNQQQQQQGGHNHNQDRDDEEESERKSLEETLAELVVKALHRLLYPGPAFILAVWPTDEQINEALSVSSFEDLIILVNCMTDWRNRNV